MIRHLLIKNYALIEHLEMSPSASLNIITGETGAGKSIMLGALGLLIGNRADKKALFDQESKCVVEGTFDISQFDLSAVFADFDLDYHDECIIRREITSSGKSRAFVNDTPTTLDVLKRLGTYLVDIHSQHDTLLLAESVFQLNVIDQFGGISKELSDYQKSYQEYLKHKKHRDNLLAEASEINKQSDYENFILNELQTADLKEDEQSGLEEKLELLENSEEIKSRFTQAIGIADDGEYSAMEAINGIIAEIKAIKGFSRSYEEIFDRLISTQIEFSDIVDEMRRLEDSVEIDPIDLQTTRERVDLINRLLQKHLSGNISELLKLQAELEMKAGKAENFDEDLQKAETKLQEAKKALQQKAEALTKERKKVFKPLTEELVGLLQKVGMPEASVSVAHMPANPGKYGADQISVLFSANKGISPQPLKNVASGGEFSRLMFCIKSLMAKKNAMPTMIFDEIDTGVSGEIALKMIALMKKMADKHQVISISHLPQFAAGADTHYYVYKDSASSRSVSKMKRLSDQERIENIARMIGGDKLTESSLQSARDLLSIG